jgi:hypothetical protein
VFVRFDDSADFVNTVQEEGSLTFASAITLYCSLIIDLRWNLCFESDLGDKEHAGLTAPMGFVTSTVIIRAIIVGLLGLLAVIALVIYDTFSDLMLSIRQTILNGNSQCSPQRTMGSGRRIEV